MTFDVAADAYDGFMGRFSVPLADLFVDFAQLPLSGRALDVGCGTGALTAVLASRFGPTEVAAVDPSASFVSAIAERFPWVDVRHGHAEDLPFEDDAFTAVMAELVVHFMVDASAGAKEMVRVTRPGGVVAVCVWDFAGGRAPQSTFFRGFADAVEGVDDESDRIGARAGDLAGLDVPLLDDPGEVAGDQELARRVPLGGVDVLLVAGEFLDERPVGHVPEPHDEVVARRREE